MFKNHRFQKIISSFTILFFAFFLILLSFHLYLYNELFYDWQYEKNAVYASFGYNETWAATHELWEYMQFRDQFYSGFFSDRDQQHMIDVRNLVSFFTIVFFLSGFLFIFFLFFVPFVTEQSFKLFFSSLCLRTSKVLFFFLACSFFATLFFDTAFLWFHKFFFFNDLWLLNPATDRLVLLYPETFFLTIFLFILLTILLFAIVLHYVGWFLRSQKSI